MLGAKRPGPKRPGAKRPAAKRPGAKRPGPNLWGQNGQVQNIVIWVSLYLYHSNVFPTHCVLHFDTFLMFLLDVSGMYYYWKVMYVIVMFTF